MLPVFIFTLATACVWFPHYKSLRGSKVTPDPQAFILRCSMLTQWISLVKLCRMTSEQDHAVFPDQMSLAWWLHPVPSGHPRSGCWGRPWCPRSSSPRPLCENTGEFLWNLQKLLFGPHNNVDYKRNTPKNPFWSYRRESTQTVRTRPQHLSGKSRTSTQLPSF